MSCKPLLTTSPNMYIYTARWLRIQLLSYTAFWRNCPDVQQGMLTLTEKLQLPVQSRLMAKLHQA